LVDGRRPDEDRRTLNQPFADVVRSRRMTRSFTSQPVDHQIIERIVALASRAPSAGKTQGWHLVVLHGAQTAEFWDCTLAEGRRAGFRWQGLLDAPVIAVPFADPQAYLARYSEADKANTGLGASEQAWPTPYWTIDAAMAVNTLLLAAEDEGLGALLFAVFNGENELRARLNVPEHLQLLGAIALGYPAPTVEMSGRSAARPRRNPDQIIHRGGW
jgi:nitroreductase